MFESPLSSFAGMRVLDLPGAYTLDRVEEAVAGTGSPTAELREACSDPASVAWSLRPFEPDEGLDVLLPRFVEVVDTSVVTALVLGDWAVDGGDLDSSHVRDLLIEHTEAFPALRSLFLGDITYLENELSWIRQCDLSPLLTAYPRLEEFGVRGSVGLHLHVPEHLGLRSLTVQSGGLPASVARGIAASVLPNLEHLELWSGREDYGNTTGPEDLAPVLSGDAFPRLRRLGLRNAEDTDVWVRSLAGAAVTPTLHTLDLSLGTLTDAGARAILDGPAFHSLERLDLHRHFLSDDMTASLGDTLARHDVEFDLSAPEEPDEWDGELHYYPAAGE